MNAINVKSEIGPLKKVLLHRPGSELLNLTPDSLSDYYLMTFLFYLRLKKNMMSLQEY